MTHEEITQTFLLNLFLLLRNSLQNATRVQFLHTCYNGRKYLTEKASECVCCDLIQLFLAAMLCHNHILKIIISLIESDGRTTLGRCVKISLSRAMIILLCKRKKAAITSLHKWRPTKLKIIVIVLSYVEISNRLITF